MSFAPAHAGKPVELGEDRGRVVARLDDQDIGARIGIVLRCGGGDAALEKGRPRLDEAPVGERLLDRRPGLGTGDEDVNVGPLNGASPACYCVDVGAGGGAPSPGVDPVATFWSALSWAGPWVASGTVPPR